MGCPLTSQRVCVFHQCEADRSLVLGMLAVDAARAQSVCRTVEQQRKHAEQKIRRDLSRTMQSEVEERLAATEGLQAQRERAAHAADEAAWLERERAWRAREAELTDEVARLRTESDAMEQKLVRIAVDGTQRARLAADEREELLERHAAALEEVSRRNAELRAEHARACAQQSAMEVELHHAEHEARLQVIECEETRGAMAAAVRELVPLRQEVVEQRSQLLEVSRATAELRAAKEDDQASFMIAKKATARIRRNKQLKTLDVAAKRHAAEMAQAEARRQEEAQVTEKAVATQLASAEERHQAEQRRRQLEEERRRQEAQEALRRQLEGERTAEVSRLNDEYEQQLEAEVPDAPTHHQ